jgi:predicted dehydrogenase
VPSVVIIGSSGHYGYALDGLDGLKEAEVVGLAPGTPGEPMDALVTALAERGTALVVSDDFRSMLDTLAPDFAVVNSHFHLQSHIATEVLNRDIHAFVEKPVALNLRDLGDLEETHARSSGDLVSMLGLRYDPAFYTAWKSVKGGSIGDIRLLHAQKSYRIGSHDEFFTNRTTYGGTIPWVGIHAIDWIQWFAGPGFRSVNAHHSTTANAGHGELEASAACLFAMDDGVFATANIDYLRPATANSHGDDRIRVAGSEGIIEVRGGRAFLMGASIPGTQELELESPGNIFTDFVRSTLGTASCLITAEESFRATRIGLLAREAADNGATVRIEKRT